MELFGLTPRAGSRNHVYILRESTEEMRRKVEALASRVDQLVRDLSRFRDLAQEIQVEISPDLDLVVAWRKVQQTSTGRSAFEWLCLSDIDLRTCSEPNRTRLVNWLKERLSDMEKIILNHNWDDEAGLYVEIPELQKWKEDALRIFGSQRPSNAQVIGGKANRHNRRFFLVIVGCLLVACAGVTVLALRSPSGYFRRPTESTKKPHQSHKSSSRAEHWQRYYEKLIGKKSNARPEECLKDLAKLLSRLYPNISPNTETSDLERIKEVLQRFKEDAKISQDVETELPHELKKLFPKGKFDPTGFVNWTEDDRNFWKNLDVSDVYQLVKITVEVGKKSRGWEVSEKVRKGFGVGEDFFPLFDHLHKFHTKLDKAHLPESIFRAYYVNEDEQILKPFMDCLIGIAEAKVIKEISQSKTKTALDCITSFIEAVGPEGKKRKDLENLLKIGHPDAEPLYLSAQGLLELGKHWDKLRNQRGSQPTK